MAQFSVKIMRLIGLLLVENQYLKTLRGLTYYEFICKIWTTKAERFTLNSIH
jgi:hypothetical protein